MVDAVNRLVANQLCSAGALWLPTVGSLYVERRPAKRLDRRTILPPCRAVQFASQQRGASLVDAIASAARVDADKADEIYRTWLARVRSDEAVTIEGVGVLKFKNFTLTPDFDRLLNPQGHAPVRIKRARRFDWVMAVGLVAVVVAGGFIAYQYRSEGGFRLDFGSGSPEVRSGTAAPASAGTIEQEAQMPQMAAQSVDTLESAEMPDADSGAAVSGQPEPAAAAGEAANGAEANAASEPAEANAASGPAAAPQPASSATPATPASAASGEVLTMASGRHYVVVGVFSSLNNARRTAADTEQRDGSMRCGVYRFGERYLVSPFAAERAEECVQYIRDHAAAFPDLWTYTAR